MNKGLIQAILGGVLGTVLVTSGVNPFTWGFWAVVLVALTMRFVGDE